MLSQQDLVFRSVPRFDGRVVGEAPLLFHITQNFQLILVGSVEKLKWYQLATSHFHFIAVKIKVRQVDIDLNWKW